MESKVIIEEKEKVVKALSEYICKKLELKYDAIRESNLPNLVNAFANLCSDYESKKD